MVIQTVDFSSQRMSAKRTKILKTKIAQLNTAQVISKERAGFCSFVRSPKEQNP